MLKVLIPFCCCFCSAQGDKSGATAVVAFIRGQDIYVGWLGDSQAVLVREGKAVRLVEPHKPEREVCMDDPPVMLVMFFGCLVVATRKSCSVS